MKQTFRLYYSNGNPENNAKDSSSTSNDAFKLTEYDQIRHYYSDKLQRSNYYYENIIAEDQRMITEGIR